MGRHTLARERLGSKGKKISLLKLNTMRVGAEERPRIHLAMYGNYRRNQFLFHSCAALIGIGPLSPSRYGVLAYVNLEVMRLKPPRFRRTPLTYSSGVDGP